MKSEDQPFRLFDNREKYLLFVTTTSEKTITAEHVGREYDCIKPKPPALKILMRGWEMAWFLAVSCAKWTVVSPLYLSLLWEKKSALRTPAFALKD